YKELRAERMQQQMAAYENQQKLIEKTEEFIERFRYKATKSNQVQSRIKQLDKLDRIEVDIEDKSALSVKFHPAPRSGQVVFSTKNAVIGYGSKIILDGIDITIQRGEKIAFVGRNGEGKTTLMRIITKELYPLDGEAGLGYNVDMGYFAQNQEDILDKNDTVFDTLDKIAVGDIRTKLRDILGAFLFRGEDVDKKVAVLSGGERARLAMAKLMLKPHNLLALDEPTNHMDLISKDILKQALINYDGTLVIVSHDRDFLDGLVDKVYEFKDGLVKEHIGGINDFLYRKKLQNLEEIEKKADIKSVSNSSGEKTESHLSYLEMKEREKAKKKLKVQVDKCEAEIAKLEKTIADIEAQLSEITDHVQISELTHKYQQAKTDLDAQMDLWAELSEQL
ncbi:MAG: ABC-F family ATP-binding cassette domain-containing protein, partial [Bacteroidales bacterium]|nr:ABC-F family ATP-binding cassette domain-containing protein [Bacteroidales bacterium]